MDWKNRLYMIQNKVKFQLHSRKVDDLEGISKLIQEFDVDGTGYLSKVQFQNFLAKSGIFLTTQELTCVYNVYDTYKDGRVNYAEFIQMIRTEMSEKRLAVVKHAFNYLDANGTKLLKIADLQNMYKAEDHPRVRTREKTVEQVRSEFLAAIQKKSKDQVNLTETEFLEYYADINATLPHEKEEYFIDLVLKTWSITTSYNYVSPERIADLELILYEKIRQKTDCKNDEGKTVKKAFHYFDLEDTGVITLDKFTKALDKFGCVFNQWEISALFKKYDRDNRGKIAYDEFCNIFATLGAGINPNINPVFQISREPPQDVLTRIIRDLKKKGIYGYRQLTIIFRKLDKTKSGKVKRSEFTWGIKEAGQTLTKHELDKIFKYFDKKCEDSVNYIEFLRYVNGMMGEPRREIVNELFRALSSGSDTVTIDELKKAFDPTANPDVKAGRKKPDDEVKEFFSLWDNIRKDGGVGIENFEDVYNDISAAIDTDGQFYEVLKNQFKVKCKAVENLSQTQSQTLKNESQKMRVTWADSSPPKKQGKKIKSISEESN